MRTGRPEPIKPPIFKGDTIYLTGKPVWKTLEDVGKAVGSKAKVKLDSKTGRLVLDLQGNRLSGQKIKRGDDRNDEGSTALKIRIDKFTIQNGVVDDIPGGILVIADGFIAKKLVFTNIGEDALSNVKDSAKATMVWECQFYNRKEGDKSLQLNDGRNAQVVKCLFTGGITAIRLVESTSKFKGQKSSVDLCSFENVDTAVNVDGHTTVFAGNNSYKKVVTEWKLGPNAKVKK